MGFNSKTSKILKDTQTIFLCYETQLIPGSICFVGRKEKVKQFQVSAGGGKSSNVSEIVPVDFDVYHS